MPLSKAVSKPHVRRTASAATVLARSGEYGTSKYASRKGSSFLEFEVDSKARKLYGHLGEQGYSLVVDIDETSLETFLAAPLRLRGQIMASLMVTQGGTTEIRDIRYFI
jgi:hypothetical protein